MKYLMNTYQMPGIVLSPRTCCDNKQPQIIQGTEEQRFPTTQARIYCRLAKGCFDIVLIFIVRPPDKEITIWISITIYWQGEKNEVKQQEITYIIYHRFYWQKLATGQRYTSSTKNNPPWREDVGIGKL